jgi:hypothetical protein
LGQPEALIVSDKHFPWVQDAKRVECAFDPFHGLNGSGGHRHAKIWRLDITDAVLAADRAAQVDRDRKGLANGLASPANSLFVISVTHEVDMDVAVASVAEIHNKRLKSEPYLFDSLDQFRDARAWNDDVFIEL